MRIAIAGAGIAGLTAAIALARRGFAVELFERAAGLEDAGAGIQLSPNAMAVLDRLGLAAKLAGKVVEPEAIEIGLAGTGKHLVSIPLGKTVRARYGAPYCVIHRADLLAVLIEAARASSEIALHMHSDLHDVRATEAGVVFSAGGRRHVSDVLVAADGVRSRIRTGFFGYHGPEALGQSAWRATLPADAVPSFANRNITGLWWGAGAHLVHYPVSAGRTINIVVISGPNAASGPPRSPFGRQLQELMDSVPQWTRWPLVSLDPALPWARGRIVLIGDAAHAMVPSAAQGGAQSIEDAWVLAQCLAARPSDAAATLMRFEETRRPRTVRVAREAKRNLWIYHLGQPLAVARNLVVSAMPPTMHLARMDWLFRGPAN